jgi:hypothetical protein
MGWDPAVLRRYNTTGHFRLLNQVRSELRANPLNRPKQGETVGEANRSRSLIRALASRAASGSRRSRSSLAAPEVVTAERAAAIEAARSGSEGPDGANSSFRDRLNAIDMR